MFQTLHQRLCQQDNDYSQLEAEYYRQTGTPMVNDPYESVLHLLPDITLSVSVVVPAWNAADSIERCLISIEQSSFNQKYPHQLEVIVVDDGSQDTTWQILEHIDLNLHVKAVHQDNHGRSHARNTAIAMSEGDIIICCDADMILSTFAIEEMMKRHQICDRVLLLGFRSPVPSNSEKFQLATLSTRLKELLPNPHGDTRINHPIGGWGLCRETDHLKQLGRGKFICRPPGLWRSLPIQVHGHLFSLRRCEFLAMQGYDEGFSGWGYEDIMVGAHAIAQGNYVIPVYAATGWHVTHEERSPMPSSFSTVYDSKRWQEYARNQVYYTQRLHNSLSTGDTNWQKRARERVLKCVEHHSSSTHARDEIDASYYACYKNAYDNPRLCAWYYFQVGRYQEAARLFSEVHGTEREEIEATRMRGKALRLAGCINEAVDVLRGLASSLSFTLQQSNAHIFADAFTNYALALAAQGRFVEARQQLRRANEVQPDDLMLHYLLKKPGGFHSEVARLYIRQQDYVHGLRACEAALILDPHDLPMQVQRAKLCTLLGKQEIAQEASSKAILSAPLPAHPENHTLLAQVWTHLTTGNMEQTKLGLERLQQIHPDTIYITQNLQKVHTSVTRSHHLSLVNTIIEDVQNIPGVFSTEELTFLITLTLKVISTHCHEKAGVFIDANSYCGRSTVAMGLALRGMGCQSESIVSVYQPAVEPIQFSFIGLPTSRELFQQVVWQYELTRQVICVPEQDALPQEQICHLLLVEGTSNDGGLPQDIAQYLATLTPGGLILAYPYRNTHSDIYQWVNTLLRDANYTWLGQVGQLIALQAPTKPTDQA